MAYFWFLSACLWCCVWRMSCLSSILWFLTRSTVKPFALDIVKYDDTFLCPFNCYCYLAVNCRSHSIDICLWMISQSFLKVQFNCWRRLFILPSCKQHMTCPFCKVIVAQKGFDAAAANTSKGRSLTGAPRLNSHILIQAGECRCTMGPNCCLCLRCKRRGVTSHQQRPAVRGFIRSNTQSFQVS